MNADSILEELCSGYFFLNYIQKKHYSKQVFAIQLQQKENNFQKKLLSIRKQYPYWFWIKDYYAHDNLINSIISDHQKKMRYEIKQLSTNHVVFKTMQRDIDYEILRKYLFGFKQFFSEQEKSMLVNEMVTHDLMKNLELGNEIKSLEQVYHWQNTILFATPYKKLIDIRLNEYSEQKITSVLEKNDYLMMLCAKNINIKPDLIVIENKALKQTFFAAFNVQNKEGFSAEEIFLQKGSLYLADFFFPVLEDFTLQLSLPFLNLYDFNRYFAFKISWFLLRVKNCCEEEIIDTDLLKQYLEQLITCIHVLLEKKHQKLDWDINPLSLKVTHACSQAKQSFFSLPFFSKIHAEAKTLGDALFCFNAAGGESELGFITNLWNVVRFKNIVKNGKSITLSFLGLFKPLYDEFMTVSNKECSSYLKLFYYLTPLLIAITTTLGLFVAGCSVLPILSSTIPSILVMVPLIVVGLFIATCFIKTKQMIAKKYYLLKCHNHYNTPGFQLNTRMIQAFGCKKAGVIKRLYVDEIKNTEKQYLNLYKKKQQGVLNTQELCQLKSLEKKQVELKQEWDKIHHDYMLGIDQLDKIVKRRFREVFRESSAEKLSEFKEQITEQVKRQSFFLFKQFERLQTGSSKKRFHFLFTNYDTKKIEKKLSGYENLLEQQEILLS